jgi:biotin-dependent carboxylase-like uncharacterized protein
MTRLTITRVGPLTTVQDDGRPGMLRHGISGSGPMDRASFELAGKLAGEGRGAIEFTASGLGFAVDGPASVGFAGGQFKPALNGRSLPWPGRATLCAGDELNIGPGHSGNYGYVRFGGGMHVPLVMGSQSTSSRVNLGGIEGRSLRARDWLDIGTGAFPAATDPPEQLVDNDGPVRFIWGIHAELFPHSMRAAMLGARFVISTRLDRMGVRLDDPEGVFTGSGLLSLVSDAIVPGDIQILGDGSPVVLMRDHQPTGGYPRIGTVITADLDRFAQLRPGTSITFQSVAVDHALQLLRGQRADSRPQR